MKTPVQVVIENTNMHPKDAAMHLIKINMSRSGLTENEMIAIANKADGIEQTYETVGQIMNNVTNRQVVIFGSRNRTYVKMATEKRIERITKNGSLISIIG